MTRRAATTDNPTTTLPSTATRRRLIAGSGLAVIAAPFVLPAAVPAVHAAPQDASLLTACMAFEAADNALYEPENPDDLAPLNPLCEAWNNALAVVADLRPVTLTGTKAKARVVMTAFGRDVAPNRGETVENEAELHEYAAWRLLHDVLALGAVA